MCLSGRNFIYKSTKEKTALEQNGGDVIANVLKNHGVTHLFTLCGGHISPILVGSKHIGIRVVDVRNEANAVFAADAMARLTGVPGVAAVTAGPGVTNTITALKNAQMAGSPLILLGGAAATVLKGRGSLQDIAQLPLIKSICKYRVSIRRRRDIIPMLETAFQKAQSGVSGPVFVECPIDLLYAEDVVREWYGIKADTSSSKSIQNTLIKYYLDWHLNRIFASGFGAMAPAPRKVLLPKAKTIKIAEAANRIAGARRPVLVVGSQAMLNPRECAVLASSLEALNIPVYLAGMARGLLGPSHFLQMRHHRKEALKQADLVMLAGMPCDFRLNYGRSFNPKAAIIGINRNKKELNLNRRPDLALHADPHETLCMLAAACPAYVSKWDAWISELRQRDIEREKHISEMGQTVLNGVNPIAFFKQLNEFLSDTSILVADGGDFVATAAYVLHPRGPLRWLDPGVFGTLGVGAGFAMGAQLSTSDAEVWLLYGDGAAGYSIPEFDTFKRHGIPVIAVVGNDASWAQIARDQVKFLHDDIGTVLRPCSYEKVVEGFGAKGFLIEKDGEVQPVLSAARAAAREGFPVLINVLIGKSDFREGSISV